MLKCPSPKKSYKHIIYVSIIMVFLILAAFLYFDLPARHKYINLKAEAEVTFRYIQSIGGIEISDRTESKGNGIISSLECRPALDCPYIFKEYFIPVANGEELSLVKDVAEVRNYTYQNEDISTSGCIELNPSTGSCGIESRKGDYKKGIAVQRVEPLSPPAQDVSPKSWRIIGVRFEY